MTDSGDAVPAAEGRTLAPMNGREGPEALRPGQAGTRGRPGPARRRGFSWRTPLAVLLIILGCVLAPLSVLGVWTANQISDTNTYVANMAPLIKDPAIQNALTNKLTNEIVTKIDVKRLTGQVAADLTAKGFTRAGALLQGVAGSVASGVQGFMHSGVQKIITGPRMAKAWVQVNRAGHQALVAVLSGRGGQNGAVGVSDGQVTLDVAPLEAVAKQDLVARGLTIPGKIPITHATFALFPVQDPGQGAEGLPAHQRPEDRAADRDPGAARPGRVGRPGPPAGADRRRARVRRVHAGPRRRPGHRRAIYLNSVPASASADAAADAFDILVRFIKTALRTLLVVGLIVAAGAFFTGPSAAAVRTRSAFSSGLARLRRGGESAGLRTGPAGTWTYAHRQPLRIGAVALAALIFVFWGHPTAVVTIVIAVMLLLALGLSELIGRPPPQPAPTPPATSG